MTSTFLEKATKVCTALSNLISSEFDTHNADTLSHQDIRTALNGKANANSVYTKTEIDNLIGDIEEDMLS